MSVAIVLELDADEASSSSCIFVLVVRTDPALHSLLYFFFSIPIFEHHYYTGIIGEVEILKLTLNWDIRMS